MTVACQPHHLHPQLQLCISRECTSEHITKTQVWEVKPQKRALKLHSKSDCDPQGQGNAKVWMLGVPIAAELPQHKVLWK